jgi:ABC-type lipoprotein release transport system permease subunit
MGTEATSMTGLKLAAMAWRNLWRNRRRTIVTLSSIIFGFLLAVLFTGLGDHTYSKMIDLAARMGGGHVTLQHADYLDRPSLKRTVRGAATLQRLALQDATIKRAATRITGQAMLAAGGKSYGAVFIAVDPRAEDEQTLSVLGTIKQGKLFDGPTGRGIVLGRKLARNLGLKLGRKVVWTMTDKRGEIVSELSRVTGIISSGAPSLDASLCILPIDTVRLALGYTEGEATQVALFIADQRDSAGVAERLRGRLPPAKLAVVTWGENLPELASFISMKVGSTLFFELIIAILVAAGIFNTLFVSVMERLREFGIMMAIGFSPRKLFSLVMWESLWIGLIGLLAAGVVTAGPYYLLNTKGLDMTEMVGKGGTSEIAGVAIDPVMYVSIYPESLGVITGAVLLATLLSGLYPAWRAGRVVPVESIKLV